MKSVFALLVAFLVGLGVGAYGQIQPFQIVSTQLWAAVVIGCAVEDEQLDGAIGEEWDDAFLLEGIELGTYDRSYRFPASVFVKTDGEFLLIAFRAEIGSHLQNVEAYVAFDSNRDAILFGPGDDLVDVRVADSQGRMLQESLDYAYQGNLQMELDTQFGGSEDVKAAATFTDGMLVAEFKRPLSSGDQRGNDPAFGPVLPREASSMTTSVGFCGEGSMIEAATQVAFIAVQQKPCKVFVLDITVPVGYEDVYDIHAEFSKKVQSTAGVATGWTSTVDAGNANAVIAVTKDNPIGPGRTMKRVFMVTLVANGVIKDFYFTDKDGKRQ